MIGVAISHSKQFLEFINQPISVHVKRDKDKYRNAEYEKNIIFGDNIKS